MKCSDCHKQICPDTGKCQCYLEVGKNKSNDFKNDLSKVLSSLEEALKSCGYLTTHSILLCKFIEKWQPKDEE